MEVNFQKKAGADSDVCEWYAKEVFPAFLNKEENVLFLENLNTQTSKEVVDAYKEASTKVRFFKADCTDLVQPIDAGMARRRRTS